jgi:hypothetical protein
MARSSAPSRANDSRRRVTAVRGDRRSGILLDAIACSRCGSEDPRCTVGGEHGNAPSISLSSATWQSRVLSVAIGAGRPVRPATIVGVAIGAGRPVRPATIVGVAIGAGRPVRPATVVMACCSACSPRMGRPTTRSVRGSTRARRPASGVAYADVGRPAAGRLRGDDLIPLHGRVLHAAPVRTRRRGAPLSRTARRRPRPAARAGSA